MTRNKDPSIGYSLSDKFRNFTFLIYPDSAPNNWVDMLRLFQIPCVISPLHTGELKEDGSLKKDHYHIVFMFSSAKTIAQALAYIHDINGVVDERYGYKKFVVADLRKMLRYLCHLDEHGLKPYYDPADVLVLGDFDYNLFIQSSKDDVEMLMNITFFISENHITNFVDLQIMLAQTNREWFELIARRATFYVTQLVKSERYRTPGTTT